MIVEIILYMYVLCCNDVEDLFYFCACPSLNLTSEVLGQFSGLQKLRPYVIYIGTYTYVGTTYATLKSATEQLLYCRFILRFYKRNAA